MSNKTVPDELSFFKDKLISSEAKPDRASEPVAAASQATSTRTPSTDPTLKEKIVVIDDSPTILTVTGGILKKFGFAAITFREPELALEELTQYTAEELVDIKAIFCDYEMKKMNGLELMTAIRSKASLQSIPFVIMTASTDKTVSQKARAMNVSSFMLKPVSTNMIMNAINGLFPGRIAPPVELKRAK
jgi:two-component system chemotaxis response regulator CheY